jgi:hypothetical protein
LGQALEDEKMTSEDSYKPIGTDLMVYHDAAADDYDEIRAVLFYGTLVVSYKRPKCHNAHDMSSYQILK